MVWLRADWDAVNAAFGRVVASVPKAKIMAVYDSVKAITDPGVPAYMKSLVNGPDAENAYQGFLEFKDVVEKNQVATASAPAVVPSGDKIGEAAKALSDASYPFIKDIDWLSDIYLKPLPGKTAPETLKAIDKMIAMGAKMDGNLLKAAAEAHHKAIGSIDAKGVTSAADYEAVHAAIGRLVASVPKTTVMDVYNSMAGVVDSTVTNNMFSRWILWMQWLPLRVSTPSKMLWRLPSAESEDHQHEVSISHALTLFFLAMFVV